MNNRRSFVTRTVLAAAALLGWRKVQAAPKQHVIQVCTWDILDAASAVAVAQDAGKRTAQKFMEVISENAGDLRGTIVIRVCFEADQRDEDKDDWQR